MLHKFEITHYSINTAINEKKAADLLHVSLPYLSALLEQGKIPHCKIGTKLKVLTKDVLTYKNKQYKARFKTLEKLSAQAQALKMGYETDE